MKNKFYLRLFVVLVFLLPLAAILLMNWMDKAYSNLPILGPVIKENGKVQYHTIADFSLVNQRNEIVTIADCDNKIVVADFFFTHCPSVCPKMTKNLQLVQANLKNHKIHIYSFSIDPERDSVERLKEYCEEMEIDNSNWDLLTGSKKEIYKLARNSFMLTATDGDGGPDDFIHSENFVLIDKHRRIRGFYEGTNEKEVERLILDIKKLENENE